MASDLRAQLQSSLGSVYTLERELGGGGMARVFVAEEAALGRKVVVKVLPPELAAGLSTDRFAREILLAARLQHPHIVPVLRAGDLAGLPYYTMPYVEGLSLRDRLARDGRLPLAEGISILRDVARALAFAHAKGVVHRDVKPDNVLLAGGVAAVTDFGIGKALAAARTGDAGEAAPETLTQVGMSVGTPEYMAPEQASADPAADHRADLYAFGVMAYEVLAGATPFHGRGPHQLFVAHLIEPPPSLLERRPDCPPALAALVMRCLEKDPAGRPQDAAELLAALDAAAGELTAPRTPAPPADTPASAADSPGPHPTDRHPIAVLPFDNLSPAAEDAYFADGLTEEVIADLAALGALRVTARASVMPYKGTTKAPAAIARELGVRYVVTGSVRRAGDELRITTRLVDTSTDATLWSDKHGGTMADVFALQERLSRIIVDALRLTLSADEDRRLAARPFADVRAFEGYLRARSLLWQGRPESLRAGERIIGATIALAGESGPLLALRGMFLLHANLLAGADTLDEAERVAQRAAALDPDSPDVHVLRSAIADRRGLPWEAIRHAQRALERQPSHAEALCRVALVAGMVGRNALCRECAERLAEVDPLNAVSVCMPGWAHLMGAEIEPALRWLERAGALDPGNPGITSLLGVAYAMAGRTEEACAALGDTARGAMGTLVGFSAGALRAGLRGDRAALEGVLTPEAQSVLRAHEWNPLYVAFAWALLGDGAAAAEWLECAIRRGFTNVTFLGAATPLHGSLQAVPRFDALLAVARAALAAGRPVGELLDALEAAPAAVPTARPADTESSSIAVLPFENLSPDPENAFFADGLTEEVISDLSQVRALRVISRTSAMRYRGAGKDLPTIARELGVRYVLEGSVRRAGNAIRVTAQLIEAATDKHLWSEKLGGTLDDVFDIQERLSRRIVEALRITLSTDETRRMVARPIADPRAHELYLRARHEMWRMTPEGMRRAEGLITAAAELVGESALLHAARAALLFQTINFGVTVDESLVPRAEAEARRALALDPDCVPAHSVLALLLASRGAIREARPLIERAVELDPGDIEARGFVTFICALGGRPERARLLAAESVSRDPLAPISHWAVATTHHMTGEFDEALAAYERASRLQTDELPMLQLFIALVLRVLGRRDEAVAVLESVARAAPGTMWFDLTTFLRCAMLGDVAGARAAMTDDLVRWARPDIQYPWHIAQGYGMLGLADEAIEWLDRAAANGFAAHEYLERHERLLDPVRSDPRFAAVLDRARRAQAELWGAA